MYFKVNTFSNQKHFRCRAKYTEIKYIKHLYKNKYSLSNENYNHTLSEKV